MTKVITRLIRAVRAVSEQMQENSRRFQEEMLARRTSAAKADAKKANAGSSGIVSAIAVPVFFVAGWIYAIISWGFFLGVALGWIPAALFALIMGTLVGAFWPLSVLALVIAAIAALNR